MELLDSDFDLEELFLADLSDLPFNSFFTQADIFILAEILRSRTDVIRGTPWNVIRGTAVAHVVAGSGPWATIGGSNSSWDVIRGTPWRAIR